MRDLTVGFAMGIKALLILFLYQITSRPWSD